MTPVEIEESVSELVRATFDADEFPFAFLAAFDTPKNTLTRLRSTGNRSANYSDLPGGVLQHKRIHIAVCELGGVEATLTALRDSPATAKHNAKFLLATDGEAVAAECRTDGEVLSCDYAELPHEFYFFSPLAGITKLPVIKEQEIDVKATRRLNSLYVELLKHNPDWGRSERRDELNHFFARLIFCYFAEDTRIFPRDDLFTKTVAQFSNVEASDTHEVVAEIFEAMNTPTAKRAECGFHAFATGFPYVNGGLFEGSRDVPRFTRTARSYLLHVGQLDWTRINPDIFGSMIQAVADDEERGSLGMHYTSVPNIRKVLDPLFLDDLWAKLDEAGDGLSVGSKRKLLNLRRRLAHIRVFDPACGSGNFLVIAYKEMRAIEAKINRRRREEVRPSDIPTNNFRGIEIRGFAAEIARLALVIAEYQCDELYRGELAAREDFLPLDRENWITCGNALRLDWLKICPPSGTESKIRSDELFENMRDQTEMDFENEGGETYICGNPPYKGSREQTKSQKSDLAHVLESKVKSYRSLDYVAAWFFLATEYVSLTRGGAAFVSTNSICQGQSVDQFWPSVLDRGVIISFAHSSFSWSNLASHNAGVTVVVVGLSADGTTVRRLYTTDSDGGSVTLRPSNINAYLAPAASIFVEKRTHAPTGRPKVSYGNYPGDRNRLSMTFSERQKFVSLNPSLADLIRPVYGAQEFLKGQVRYCVWINNSHLERALNSPDLAKRIQDVKAARLESRDPSLNKLAERPHQYRDRREAKSDSLFVPTISSERRNYLPVDLKPSRCLSTNQAYVSLDPPRWIASIITSRLHLTWVATVCGKLKTDYRYSNTLGWNTFPVPPLSDQNKADLTKCAEEILLARERHWPATIADMYDPDRMDAEFPDLRAAHERNDETLERIYIGRRFKNDTERLEHLFDLYNKMTAEEVGS